PGADEPGARGVLLGVRPGAGAGGVAVAAVRPAGDDVAVPARVVGVRGVHRVGPGLLDAVPGPVPARAVAGRGVPDSGAAGQAVGAGPRPRTGERGRGVRRPVRRGRGQLADRGTDRRVRAVLDAGDRDTG